VYRGTFHRALYIEDRTSIAIDHGGRCHRSEGVPRPFGVVLAGSAAIHVGCVDRRDSPVSCSSADNRSGHRKIGIFSSCIRVPTEGTSGGSNGSRSRIRPIRGSSYARREAVDAADRGRFRGRKSTRSPSQRSRRRYDLTRVRVSNDGFSIERYDLVPEAGSVRLHNQASPLHFQVS